MELEYLIFFLKSIEIYVFLYLFIWIPNVPGIGYGKLFPKKGSKAYLALLERLNLNNFERNSSLNLCVPKIYSRVSIDLN